jgi:hypothetical protein
MDEFKEAITHKGFKGVVVFAILANARIVILSIDALELLKSFPDECVLIRMGIN